MREEGEKEEGDGAGVDTGDGEAQRSRGSGFEATNVAALEEGAENADEAKEAPVLLLRRVKKIDSGWSWQSMYEGYSRVKRRENGGKKDVS